MKTLVLSETRVYEVADEEAESLRERALDGDIDIVPVSVTRHASLPDDDPEDEPQGKVTMEMTW